MKLLTRSTYYYIFFSTIALVISGFIFYYSIRIIVYRQIDDSLITEREIIQEQIDKTESIPNFTGSFGHQIEVRLLKTTIKYSQTIRDTNIYDTGSDSYLPYRHLKFSNTTHGKTGYTISIYQLREEDQELLDSISLGMVLLFLVLLIVSISVNYFVSKKIWRPFFDAINEAGNYNVLSDNQLQLPDTDIEEFNELNGIFEHMTGKMRKDYLNLKEYNENSSHEIQTPLAVIRSKLDILVQNDSLNEEAIEIIRSINGAVSRIFKLNQGLLLISKIENLQFQETKEISLKDLVTGCLDNYEEILRLKEIKVETDFSDNGMVYMNELLADVMISNLLGNAVRYNVSGGFIRCTIDDKYLILSNSGMPLRADPQNLFKRFHKGSDHPDAVGLGLSIVKKITDHYKMEISYTCTGPVHEIRLKYGC